MNDYPAGGARPIKDPAQPAKTQDQATARWQRGGLRL